MKYFDFWKQFVLLKCEIDQNKNKIVNALEDTDIIFTANAIWSDSKAKVEKIAPSI